MKLHEDDCVWRCLQGEMGIQLAVSGGALIGEPPWPALPRAELPSARAEAAAPGREMLAPVLIIHIDDDGAKQLVGS